MPFFTDEVHGAEHKMRNEWSGRARRAATADWAASLGLGRLSPYSLISCSLRMRHDRRVGREVQLHACGRARGSAWLPHLRHPPARRRSHPRTQDQEATHTLTLTVLSSAGHTRARLPYHLRVIVLNEALNQIAQVVV